MTGPLWPRRFGWGLGFALLLSTAGWVSPVGDSIAAFRIDLLVASGLVLVWLLWTGSVRLALALLVAVLITGWPVMRLAGGGAPPDRADITLHQHNLLFLNKGLPDFTAHVLATAPDVITVQEIARNRRYLVQALSAEYPNLQLCSYDGPVKSGSVGVMTRDIGKVVDSGCAEKTELAWITMDTAHGRITFASLHLFWPWPQPQSEQFTFLEPALKDLTQPLIIGGDFNNVAWSHIVSSIAAASGTRPAKGLASTFSLFFGWPRLRIDHILVPQRAIAHVERTPKLGSDHNGLRAEIRIVHNN